MRQNLRSTLPDKMQLSFPSEFVHTKSSIAGPTFPCMHYVWYNRYSVHVQSNSFIYYDYCDLLFSRRQSQLIMIKNQRHTNAPTSANATPHR